MAGDLDQTRTSPSHGRGRLGSQAPKGKQAVTDESDCTAVTSSRGGGKTRPPSTNLLRSSMAGDPDPGFVADTRRISQALAAPPTCASSSRTKSSSSFSSGRAALPFMDKGKQPAKEQVAERPQPTGFMADARRISRGPTAPPTHATLSYTKSRNRVREEAVSNFTLKPLGSTVTRPFILRNEVFTELLPHQVEGLEWLWNIHCRGTGGLVADDMGLGKTKQILAFLAGLLESKLMKTALIAVPAAIVHQWIEEMIDLGLENYIHIFKDKQTRKEELAKFCESGGLLITTHTLATNNWSVLKGPWDYMIIDEAHVTCKKETLKSYCNLQRLHCSHRILLTGTPSPNGLKELRAILNFCCPGIFSSVKDFHENYLAPLVEGNYKGSSSEQLNESFKASQKLQGLLSPCFLRRLKNVLSSTDTPEKKRLNLPEKVEFVVWLRLSPYQEKLYRELLSGGIVRKNNPGEMIVASTLMQKICNHPTKLDKISQEDLDGTQRFVLKCMVKKLRSRTSTDDRHFSEEHHSSKLDIIVRLLERFNEQKLRVLIFSRTCEMLDAIEVLSANPTLWVHTFNSYPVGSDS